MNRSARQGWILWSLTVLSIIFIFRLFFYTVAQHGRWFQAAHVRLVRSMSLEATRGRILAVDGQTVLARSDIKVSVAVDTLRERSTGRDAQTARELAEILDLSTELVRSKLHSRFNAEWIKRDINPEEFNRILDLKGCGKLRSIRILREITREYPQHPVCASIVGFARGNLLEGWETLGPFTGFKGIEGLEASFNDLLEGRDGSFDYLINRFGAPEPDTITVRQPAQSGNDVVVTLDPAVQAVLRARLTDSLLEHRAGSVMGIIMDPMTGAILASDSVENMDPHLDPDYRLHTPINCWPPEARRNLPATSVFEPGSVWKPIMMAIALERNLAVPSEQIDWQPTIVFGRKIFKDWKTFPSRIGLDEVLVHSSNVGIIKISKRIFNSLSSRQIAAEIMKMGFYREVPRDYPVHPRGTLNHGNWGPVSVGAVAEGYELAVSLVQICAFYCSIANGGYRVEPHFGRSIVHHETGRLVRSLDTPVSTRILSPQTVRFISRALIDCIDHGTGRQAGLHEYGVAAAGKTATAKLLDEGSYASGKYRASFAGYFPADNPRYVIAVSVEDPGAGLYYGGSVAAPLFKSIAEGILKDIHGMDPVPEVPQC
ncbi:penicillin-binding protein 2 [bacterium]|nr:penicillin-binding protein 2 [candidate division CSSED10-310 bacterium]